MTGTVRRWVRVCSLRELEPGRGVAALVDGNEVALFLLPDMGGEPAARLRAVDNRDPVTGVAVLSRGLLGRTGEVDYVASPLHKHRFDLASGRCLDGVSPGVRVWPVRVWGSTVEVLSVTGPEEAPVPAAVASHCPFCALQCGVRLEPGVPAAGDPAFPVNEGRLCVKGRASTELMGAPGRLTRPLVRDRSGRLVEASWDAALDDLAGRLSTLAAASGPDSVGVFGSGALTNEKAYLLGKFARVALRTANIDYNGRFCMASAAAASNRAFGVDRGLPFPLSDVALTDTLVLWGANPADTMPPLMRWVDRMRARRGRLIVVDPRVTATAAVADRHVRPRPGSDLAVALGLLHLVIEHGLVDRSYVRDRTAGFDQVAESVGAWTPEAVERASGVPRSDLEALVDGLARVPAAMLVTGRGPEQSSKGTDTVSALINLMLALGRVGRPASGYGCLTGQANGQGGREHGQKADQLPGYRSIADPSDRAAVAGVWGVDPADLPGPGMSAVEMIGSIGRPGGVRALLVCGSDVSLAAPDRARAAAALGSLDCLAVMDAFPNRTTEAAHFVLPVHQWAEEDGTTTSLEGRVLRRRRAASPPAGTRSDIEVLCDLAGRLGSEAGGFGGFGFSGPEAVFDELRRASAGGRADYSGITYARLDAGEALHWPCPEPGHPGTPRLFTDRFAHPDGRARFAAVADRPPAEVPDPEYPLWLTTGRDREHYNTGTQTRRLGLLTDRRPQALLHVHPDQATGLGVTDGTEVVVESRRGRARFAVRVTAEVQPGTVFAPIHWDGEAAVNHLTGAALDPTSRMPELKTAAVRLSRPG